MLFSSRMQLLLTLRASYALSFMKCFQIHLLEDMAQQVGQQSPDTDLPDFFLCGIMKNQVYCTSVHHSKQRKRRIRTTIGNVSQVLLNNIWINFENRLHTVISEFSGHIKHQ